MITLPSPASAISMFHNEAFAFLVTAQGSDGRRLDEHDGVIFIITGG